MIAGAVLVLGGAAAAVVLLAHPFSHNESASNAANSGTSARVSASAGASARGSATPAATPSSSQSGLPLSAPGPSASATATQVTEQQAATRLAGMLSQSVSDRTAIIAAVSDVNSCGPSLNQDPQVFDSAASSRRILIADLASMPGRSALPAPLLQDLTNAWQASIAADQDFARWANDEITNGCTPDDTADPGYAAAATPDNEATYYKKAFAGLWDPIATQYGLTPYQWNQL